MRVYNTYAKIPYWYNRYEYSELTLDELKAALYENAYRTANRHLRLECVGNKNGRGISYYRIYCGFDCETYTDTEAERSYMYIWQFSINKNVIRGRTYEELLQFLSDIKMILQPGATNRLLVFDHNMGYEASFFLRWLDLPDARENFFKDRRKPLKLTHGGFCELRDSMALVGGASLTSLAKDYCNTQKAKGDLDYSIPRNRYSILDEQENTYVDNDVLILSEYSEWVFNNILSKYTKLPLTQTGLLANESKYFLMDFYNNNIDQWQRNNARRWPKTINEYQVKMDFLYRGGYTHACASYVGEELEIEDIMGVDITSSYPYCMVQKIYPKMFDDPRPATRGQVEADYKNGLVSTFIAELSNVKSTGLHSIESKSKCLELSPDAQIDNGRVYSASKMKVFLTCFDWVNYCRYYTFTDVKITCYQTSERRYLYKHIACPMLSHYKDKAVKKAAGEPYAEDKVKVNTYYGYLCKKLNDEQTKYDNNGFSLDDARSYEEQVQSSITCCYDGIFVSAYARYRLLDLCWRAYKNFGIKGIYADTDSWKFLHPTDEFIEWLEDLNHEIRSENKANIEYFTDYDEVYADLGEWDIEFYPWRLYDPANTSDKKAYLKRFKTLGAKRYLLEVNEINKATGERENTLHQTIAGLAKGELMKQYKTIDNCFKAFSDRMLIEYCDLTSKYIDEPYEITVTDTQGHTDTHTELSCCALIPSNFTLKLDALWKLFYTELADEAQNDREFRVL